ncbi:SPOR domain-containing protein [Thalassospiraceae bacterium LMO-SO8]|nr:SPOR domain-containing protein [Alphaproteobacteria bacterium LMO-S08]WND75399.1 SPOR domain-containing protein [Thalassospiraceae bacterium LMO-SO8]
MARRPTSDIRVSASDALEFEPEPRRRRGIPTTVWLLLVLILVTAAGLGGFLFGDRLAGLSGEESGQVPVVHAAEGAIKVRPDNPGGQDIPFRDYDINKRMQGEAPTGRVENLLPPPEQPRELPRAQASTASTAPAQVPPVPAATAGAQLAPPTEQSNAEALLPSAPAPAPKPAAPTSMPAREVAPPPPATVAKAPTPQPAPPPPVPASPAASSTGGPIALVPKSATAAPAAAQPTPVAKVAPPPPSAPAATETAALSGWQVQLAASRAATAAKAEGERLKQKHSDVLGKLAVNIVRADLGAKGVFYRIRLGPARDKDEARAVCAQLAKRGQGCLVIAPGK